jgi:hypothetical protein
MDQSAGGVTIALAGTRPWVRLVSILGFLGAGFMFLVGIALAVGGTAVTGALGEQGGPPFAILGVIYACMGLLYFVPSLHLWRYGGHIQAYLHDPQTPRLELALEAQRRFWKFVGILAAISIVFFFLTIGVAILIPLMRGATPV